MEVLGVDLEFTPHGKLYVPDPNKWLQKYGNEYMFKVYRFCSIYNRFANKLEARLY
jgi:hypothetical protein